MPTCLTLSGCLPGPCASRARACAPRQVSYRTACNFHRRERARGARRRPSAKSPSECQEAARSVRERRPSSSRTAEALELAGEHAPAGPSRTGSGGTPRAGLPARPESDETPQVWGLVKGGRAVRADENSQEPPGLDHRPRGAPQRASGSSCGRERRRSPARGGGRARSPRGKRQAGDHTRWHGKGGGQDLA